MCPTAALPAISHFCKAARPWPHAVAHAKARSSQRKRGTLSNPQQALPVRPAAALPACACSLRHPTRKHTLERPPANPLCPLNLGQRFAGTGISPRTSMFPPPRWRRHVTPAHLGLAFAGQACQSARAPCASVATLPRSLLPGAKAAPSLCLQPSRPAWAHLPSSRSLS